MTIITGILFRLNSGQLIFFTRISFFSKNVITPSVIKKNKVAATPKIPNRVDEHKAQQNIIKIKKIHL